MDIRLKNHLVKSDTFPLIFGWFEENKTNTFTSKARNRSRNRVSNHLFGVAHRQGRVGAVRAFSLS